MVQSFCSFALINLCVLRRKLKPPPSRNAFSVIVSVFIAAALVVVAVVFVVFIVVLVLTEVISE